MPDRPDEMTPFTDALQRLAPQQPNLSRDALLFAAGQASAGPRVAPWVWPSVAGSCAAMSLVLAAFLAFPGEPGVQIVDRTQTVYVKETPPEPPAISQPPPEPDAVVKQPKAPPKDDSAEVSRQLQRKRDILRWGVDMMPESKAAGGGPSEDMLARDLTRWLNLPPGTFALPAHQPRKSPKPEEDEE